MAGVVASWRQRVVSRPLLRWYRGVLPAMSATERQALEAGTLWWDAELFSGRPRWGKLLELPKAELSAEEQAFLDGPTEELCRMLDDWTISFELCDLPPEVWQYLRAHRFFGLIIPQEYGGLGFSALGHSAVVMKIASRSLSAAVTVMVPNSLGPAELLLKYGTDEQKDRYLPRLASGEELPCFAMTGPTAGSDAAAMPDRGVVCYGDDGHTLGVRVSWQKRYITLGPVATLMGLAFRLHDPDHLLGDEEDRGITLALVPTDTPGVKIGRRHYPAHQAFQNGPTSGDDVFVPMAQVLGGERGVGQGWRMLMECLAAGRAISLPSLSTGGVQLAARTTGAYARVREQFGLPLGRFEGIKEPLARIAGHAYLLDAARRTTATAIDRGERPGVISALIKYHATERMRAAVNDAMDIHGGKTICDGPRNYLANVYYAVPMSITVEGANILTRSLIVFGQGAMRCHPHLLEEMRAAHDADEARGLERFDRALFGHLGFLLRNLGRALWHNLSGGRFAPAPPAGPATGYYRQLSRSSASFALLADAALGLLGGELKRRERLSARLGDVLSEMYLVSCALKRFEDDGRPEDDLVLLDWCCQSGLHTIERRFDEILANFPSRPAAWLLRVVLFPFGRRRRPPADALEHRCADLLLTPSEARDRLTAGIYVSTDPDDAIGRLERALATVVKADGAARKFKTLRRERGLSSVDEAVRAGAMDEAEARLLDQAEDLVGQVIAVDDFAPEELSREHKRWQTAEPSVARSSS